MVEQIVNMKKRYKALVERFTKEDFDQYFAEFFTLHTCLKYIRWQQYPSKKGRMKVVEILVSVNPGYVLTHTTVSDHVHRMSLLDTTDITSAHKNDFPQLWDAIVDLRALVRAVDVLEFLFTDHAVVEATSKGIHVSYLDEDGNVKSPN